MIGRPFVYSGYFLEGDMLTNQFEDLYPARKPSADGTAAYA